MRENAKRGIAGRELSREIEIAKVPASGWCFAITAEPAERTALAARLGIEAIEHLHAEGRLSRSVTGGLLTLEGRLEAEVVQRCVVTLEPFSARLEVELRRFFAPARGPQLGEVVVDPLADEPEPLEGPVLDVGEIVAEELALALDPYPRAPGARLARSSWGEENGPDGSAAEIEGVGGRS